MKRILVALDASERAPTVLRAAAQLAELANAQLLLFRAVTIPPELPRELLLEGVRLEETLMTGARGELERMAATLPPSLACESVVSFATPWDGICRTAREREADLVVIGSHGYHGIDRVLGTTAAKVVNHADRNVLVVRTAL